METKMTSYIPRLRESKHLFFEPFFKYNVFILVINDMSVGVEDSFWILTTLCLSRNE